MQRGGGSEGLKGPRLQGPKAQQGVAIVSLFIVSTIIPLPGVSGGSGSVYCTPPRPSPPPPVLTYYLLSKQSIPPTTSDPAECIMTRELACELISKEFGRLYLNFKQSGIREQRVFGSGSGGGGGSLVIFGQ